jgi:hypothetical protein
MTMRSASRATPRVGSECSGNTATSPPEHSQE